MRKHRLSFGFGLMFLLLLLPGCGLWRRRQPPPPPPPVVRAFRLPDRQAPLENFQLTAGWQGTSDTGTVQFEKNEAKAIWGDYAGEIQFTPDMPGPHEVTLTPREPWYQPSVFNTLLLWVWDDGPAGFRDDHAIVLQALDREGETHTWTMPYTPADEWQMLHLRREAGYPWPVRIESLRWQIPGEGMGVRRLFLEGLTAYQESLARIPGNIPYVRPYDYAPAFAPRRAESVMLDFPTRPAAFRPEPPSGRQVVSIERIDAETHELRYEGEGGRLTYRVRAVAGAPEVDVLHNDVVWPAVWRDWGALSDAGPPAPRYSRVENRVLHLQYERGLRYSFSLQGRTLQVEIHCLGETFGGLHLGSLGGGEGVQAAPHFVPLMRVGEEARWPLMRLQKAEDQLFVSLIPDWWFSMSGKWVPGRSADGRENLGSFQYPSRWKGTRNVFRERVYLTVSPWLEGVLPTATAPEALHRDLAGQLLWRAGALPPDLDLFSMRPTHPNWRDDMIARNPDGEWRRFNTRHHILKSGRFPETLGPRLRYWPREAGAAWVVRGVDVPPWELTDFDARMLGAGTFAQTWAETGAMLQQAAAETGVPLLAPGGVEWLQAGFVSGFVPEFTLGFMELHPYLPHFAHRVLAPHVALHGLGPTSGFRLPGEPYREEVIVHRQIAAQIAYGACGRLPEVSRPELLDRAKRILGPMHQLFTTDTVVRLAWWDGQRFVEAGEAMRSGDWVRSRVYFRMESGTEIWVNGDLHGNWRIRAGGDQYELPPSGFMVRGEDLRMVHAQDEAGLAYTAAWTPAVRWLDSPSSTQHFSGMAGRGLLRLERDDAKQRASFSFRDARGEIFVSSEAVAGRRNAVGSVTVSAGDAVEMSAAEDGWWIQAADGSHSIEFSW